MNPCMCPACGNGVLVAEFELTLTLPLYSLRNGKVIGPIRGDWVCMVQEELSQTYSGPVWCNACGREFVVEDNKLARWKDCWKDT